MAILNSFVNDIFERIATEASSKLFVILVYVLILIVSFRTRCLFEKIYDLIARDPNISTLNPSR